MRNPTLGFMCCHRLAQAWLPFDRPTDFDPALGAGPNGLAKWGGNQRLTASFRPLPALNLGVFDAAILIASPVRGLRPMLAARCATAKLPKPITLTSWPVFRASVMASNVASTAWPAPALDMPVRSATDAMRSFLFMETSLSRIRAEGESGPRLQGGTVLRNARPGKRKRRIPAILMEIAACQ